MEATETLRHRDRTRSKEKLCASVPLWQSPGLRRRFTKDMDILVRPSAENAQRLLQALDDFGFGQVGLTEDDFSAPGMIIQLGIVPNRIDLITAIGGVTPPSMRGG